VGRGKGGFGGKSKRHANTSAIDAGLKHLESAANSSFDSGNIDNAERLYRKILDAKPQSASTLLKLSSICGLKSESVEQQYLLERLLSIKPDSFVACFNLGTIALQNGNENKAVVLLERAHRLNPNDTDCRYNLALTYQILGKTKTAINHYRELLDNGLSKPALYTNLSVCLYESGLISESLDLLEVVIDKHPHCTEALCQLAIISEYLADYKKAYSCLTRVIDVAPSCLPAYRRLCCLPDVDQKALYSLLKKILLRDPSLKNETEYIEAISCLGYQECLSLLYT